MITTSSNINQRKYGELLLDTLPTVIKTEEENDRAISIIENLLAKGDKPSPEESVLLELIGKLINDFEEQFYIPRSVEPREILIELMNARGLKQTDLAYVLGSRSRVSEVISGKRELSKAQIKSLSEFFNLSAELFI